MFRDNTFDLCYKIYQNIIAEEFVFHSLDFLGLAFRFAHGVLQMLIHCYDWNHYCWLVVDIVLQQCVIL